MFSFPNHICCYVLKVIFSFFNKKFILWVFPLIPPYVSYSFTPHLPSATCSLDTCSLCVYGTFLYAFSELDYKLCVNRNSQGTTSTMWLLSWAVFKTFFFFGGKILKVYRWFNLAVFNECFLLESSTLDTEIQARSGGTLL